MIPGGDWQPAFLAVGALLGEPIEASVAALGDRPTPPAGELVRALGSPSREARARAIAGTVAAVLVELDRARLA
ncbi:MAG TPA: hypothetical protein VIF15_02580 [Polyangiaceae bacterium]|jgi:hypothetical protein